MYVCFVGLLTGYIALPAPAENFNIKEGYAWDEYIPELALKINNVNDVVNYTDTTAKVSKRQSLEYVRRLSRTVSDCFFHGYSYYSFRHNWMAWLAGRFIWSDLDAIVIPNDILKHPRAACSQVSIVLAACLRKIGVPYRKVGLKGHFVLEAMIDNQWYLFDANLEPHFPHGRRSLEELMKSGDLFSGYAGRKTNAELQEVFSRIDYGPVNGPLAPRATLFHRVTYVLSFLIAIILCVLVAADCYFAVSRKLRAHQLRSTGKETAGGYGPVEQSRLEYLD